MEAAQDNQQPLLPETASPTVPGKQPKTPAQKAMRKTFKGTAHLANLLPTGTVLAFQILSPVVTDQGRCPNAASRGMTLCMIAVSAFSCFVCCFTDSVRDSRGKVRAEQRQEPNAYHLQFLKTNIIEMFSLGIQFLIDSDEILHNMEVTMSSHYIRFGCGTRYRLS